VRRFIRPLVIAIATLGLALAAGVGLAAPALGDVGFTAILQSPASVVAGSTTSLVFGGSKDAGSVITDVKISNPTAMDLGASICATSAAGDADWSCTYTPTVGYAEATGSTIEIDYTNTDASPGSAIISFDVDAAPTPPPAVGPAPAADTPAASATISVTPEFIATIAGSTDPAFTGAVDGTVDTETYRFTFGGSKTASSELVDVYPDFAYEYVDCTGEDAGSTAWSCTLEVDDALETGDYSIVITEQNDDGTVLQNVLTFVVVSVEDTSPSAPEVAYEFSPNGVTVAAVAASDATAIATRILAQGDGYYTIADCPDGADRDTPFGTSPQSAVTCSVGDLPPNYGSPFIVSTSQGVDVEGTLVESSDRSNGVFWVPDNDTSALTFTNNAASRTVTITGEVTDATADSLGESEITRGAVDVLDSTGAVVCSTQGFTSVDEGSYTFSCTTPELSYGTHALSAAIVDQGMADGETIGEALYESGLDTGTYVLGALSAAAPVGTVTFAAPTTPGGTAGDTAPNWSFSITGDLTNVHPGDSLTITGSGLPSGTSLDTVLHSVPTDLGAVVAAADGTFTQTVTIPSDVELGDHTIQVTASGPGITTTTKQQALTVTAPQAAGSGSSGNSSGVETTKPTATDGNGEGTGGTHLQPNILTRALTPFADIAVHPNKIVSAFEIGLVLLLLAVLPAHLLNATVAEQSDRFERRFGGRRRPNWLVRLGAWFKSAPVTGGVIVTLATAILFGFADPKFGFTLASLRLILACGIALFLVGYVANALTGVIARVQWNIVAAVSTRPYGLILTIVGVIISRALHFSPGFLIGLILGLTIQGKSAAGFAWRTVVLRSSIVLLMAIAAWIGYSTLTLGGNEGGTFWSALLIETLVAITTEGVVALLVELLPLRFLEGERVYAHSRVLWGIFYLVTLVVFVLAVVPWEGNWDALHGSLWIWIIVLAAFAAVCIGIYVYFRRFAPPLEEEAGDEEVALGETVAGDRS
jgi:hypothetical protein